MRTNIDVWNRTLPNTCFRTTWTTYCGIRLQWIGGSTAPSPNSNGCSAGVLEVRARVLKAHHVALTTLDRDCRVNGSSQRVRPL
jgi:hypothetical protein